jgi:hypothetical protein
LINQSACLTWRAVVDSIRVPRRDVTAHLTAISELAAATGQPAEMPPYYLEIIATYDRCRSMFGAVSSEGYSVRAPPLARSRWVGAYGLAF